MVQIYLATVLVVENGDIGEALSMPFYFKLGIYYIYKGRKKHVQVADINLKLTPLGLGKFTLELPPWDQRGHIKSTQFLKSI